MLAKKYQLNFEDYLNEAEQLNIELSSDLRFEILSANLGFVLRTIRRVMRAIVQHLPVEGGFQQEAMELPELNYRAYQNMLSVTVRNEILEEK